MKATINTYATPNGSWLGWIDLPGWTIFIPADGGKPHIVACDQTEPGDKSVINERVDVRRCDYGFGLNVDGVRVATMTKAEGDRLANVLRGTVSLESHLETFGEIGGARHRVQVLEQALAEHGIESPPYGPDTQEKAPE